MRQLLCVDPSSVGIIHGIYILGNIVIYFKAIFLRVVHIYSLVSLI
jgi:hypothetical protein